jgi:hypothetical protein
VYDENSEWEPRPLSIKEKNPAPQTADSPIKAQARIHRSVRTEFPRFLRKQAKYPMEPAARIGSERIRTRDAHKVRADPQDGRL